MKLWTAIMRCRECRTEINRAEHVPEHQKSRVAISAPIVGLCPTKSHNTASDYTLNFDLEWLEELPPEERKCSNCQHGPECALALTRDKAVCDPGDWETPESELRDVWSPIEAKGEGAAT